MVRRYKRVLPSCDAYTVKRFSAKRYNPRVLRSIFGSHEQTVVLTIVMVLVACFTFPFPAKAESRVITVPDDYNTIQAAVNAANTGDTVYGP